jgi:hypothetical protein
MARPILKTLGGKPKLVSVFGRDWRTVSSSCGVYVTLWDVLRHRTDVGANGRVGDPASVLRGLTLPSGA